jgi:hypothetical protein
MQSTTTCSPFSLNDFGESPPPASVIGGAHPGLAPGLLRQGAVAASECRWYDALQYARAALAIDHRNPQALALQKAARAMLKPPSATDNQTGREYILQPETPVATIVATIAMAYAFVALLAAAWFLFDTWVGRNLLVNELGYEEAVARSDSYQLFAFIAGAGALGAALDAVRSLIRWHAELEAFGVHFIWKTLASPLIGAAVGVIVYVTIRAGAGVISGDLAMDGAGPLSAASGFAIGACAGFNWHQVFKWLDARSAQLFRVSAPGVEDAHPEAGRPAATQPGGAG